MHEIGDYLYYPKRIGRGSYSQVYKGYHKITYEPVAIKKIDLLAIKHLSAQLKAEIDIMQKVDHPNILKLYEVITDPNDEYIYLILEYCRHGDLSYYIKKRPLNEVYARKYMLQLSSALKHLYSLNIMHRDIKPHNILLTDKDTIKLSDFGFARFVEENQMVETLCGSPLYMAPEICNNMQYTIKADLWSIGVLLFEMVTGSPPYVAKNHLELIRKLLHDDFRFPRYIELSMECKNLICKLLTKDVEERIGWDDFFHHVWLRPTVQEDNEKIFDAEILFEPTHDLFDDITADEILMYDFDSFDDTYVNTTPYHSAYDVLPTKESVECLTGKSAPSAPVEIPQRIISVGGIPQISTTVRYEMLPMDVFYQGNSEGGFQIIDAPLEFQEYRDNTPSSIPDTVLSYMSSSIKYMKSWFN